MTPAERVAEWKANAWKPADFAAGYARTMHAPANRLRNAVEADILQRYVRGETILDVGIGSGRASLQFAGEGRSVTGVDTSQAMLDLCASEAGARPVDLVLATMDALPFPDDSFDTVLALNVMVHRPDWRGLLDEWSRVTKPGGRIVFDIHSLDHVIAATRVHPEGAADAASMMNAGDPATYCAHASTLEIVAAANGTGLAIEALVPYAGLDDRNFWMRSDANDDLWERLVGYAGVSDDVFAFCFFLERSVCGSFSPAISGRMMVVLERRSPAENLRYRKTVQQQSATLPGDPTCNAEWRRVLGEHLTSPRNRVLMYRLLSKLVPEAPTRQLATLLGEDVRHTFNEYARGEIFEAACVDLLRSWSGIANVSSDLHYRGVPLAPALEYAACQRLMHARKEGDS